MFTIDEYLAAKRVGARYTGRAGSDKTIYAYRTGLRLAERLVGKPLSKFTEADADTLMHKMNESSYEKAYKANILAALRGAFSWAIGVGRYEGSHPFAAIGTPQVRRKIPTILSQEQLTCFFAAFRRRKYRLFFKLMYYGGLRIGEVRMLKRTDFDDEGIIINGKGDKQRYVYLPAKLYGELREYMNDHNESEYVFYGYKVGQPIGNAELYKEFGRAKEICGLPEALHPHNLRHTSATHMHAHTGDLAMTQKFLGHSNPQTTMIYIHTTDQQLKKAQKAVFER
jgi:integrase